MTVSEIVATIGSCVVLQKFVAVTVYSPANFARSLPTAPYATSSTLVLPFIVCASEYSHQFGLATSTHSLVAVAMIVSPISGSFLSSAITPTSGCAAASNACTTNVPTLSVASKFHVPSATTISPAQALYETVRDSPIAAAITLLPTTSCHCPSASGPTDSFVTESQALTSTVAPLPTTVITHSLTDGSLTGATVNSQIGVSIAVCTATESAVVSARTASFSACEAKHVVVDSLRARPLVPCLLSPSPHAAKSTTKAVLIAAIRNWVFITLLMVMELVLRYRFFASHINHSSSTEQHNQQHEHVRQLGR